MEFDYTVSEWGLLGIYLFLVILFFVYPRKKSPYFPNEDKQFKIPILGYYRTRFLVLLMASIGFEFFEILEIIANDYVRFFMILLYTIPTVYFFKVIIDFSQFEIKALIKLQLLTLLIPIYNYLILIGLVVIFEYTYGGFFEKNQEIYDELMLTFHFIAVVYWYHFLRLLWATDIRCLYYYVYLLRQKEDAGKQNLPAP